MEISNGNALCSCSWFLKMLSNVSINTAQFLFCVGILAERRRANWRWEGHQLHYRSWRKSDSESGETQWLWELYMWSSEHCRTPSKRLSHTHRLWSVIARYSLATMMQHSGYRNHWCFMSPPEALCSRAGIGSVSAVRDFYLPFCDSVGHHVLKLQCCWRDIYVHLYAPLLVAQISQENSIHIYIGLQ